MSTGAGEFHSDLPIVQPDSRPRRVPSIVLVGPRAGSVSTWARLIWRVYEVDPLTCRQCGGAMKLISFIERRQQDLTERIPRHSGLWEGPLRTLAHPRAPPAPAEPDEAQPRELQLVLDPEFL